LIFESIAILSLVAWIFIICARGGFWVIRQSWVSESNRPLKSVAVVIPARNEESVISEAIHSLLKQTHTGPLHIFIVDDHSTDATIAAAGTHERLTVLRAGPLPSGWAGKVWAMSEGLKHAERLRPDYILLTDADIVHAPDNISRLVARTESERLDLSSLMVKLQCKTFAERALMPAFVYFFFQLYPPAWISNPNRKTAGAAGGCMLVRPSALTRIGGIAAIRGELIDDCALARAIKPGGKIWLGITGETRSIRSYGTFGEIARMISRTAYTQLRYSPLFLFATIVGMIVVYIAPPVLVAVGGFAAALGLFAWLLMSITFIPMLRFYRRSIVWAPFLPAIALFYLYATLISAVRYWTGKGGDWKDRAQAARSHCGKMPEEL
jgi:hopene-associated glycosyltransferase HpnB